MNLVFQMRQVLFQNCLSFLLLNFENSFKLVELIFDILAQLIRFMAELRGHLLDLHLINSIFRDLVNDLIHLNQQLCSNGKFSDNLRLFANIVALVRAKQGARGANTHPILYADDLNFAIVLLTVLHSEAILLRF